LLVPPGNYTVKLTGGGQELSQPLIVKKDPNTGGSEADIQAQTLMLSELRKDLESAADMVNQIEIIRSQLDSTRTLLPAGEAAEPVRSAAASVDKKLGEVEDKLIQRRLTGAGQDSTRWPAQLMSKIAYLASGLGSSDFGPTTQQREVQSKLEADLAVARKGLDEAIRSDLAAFNKLLRDRGVQNIITGAP
jgi:hypothetical protein